jgi:hypothetical protein
MNFFPKLTRIVAPANVFAPPIGKDVSAQKEYLISEGLRDRVRRVLGLAAALRKYIEDKSKTIFKHLSLSCTCRHLTPGG